MQKITTLVLLAIVAVASATTQVLVWNVEEIENPSLVAEWKNGKNLDCMFASSVDGSKGKVSAHKAIVGKYSPYLQKLMKTSNGPIVVPYSVNVIKALLTLMYQHEVEIDQSDYSLIMKAAKAIQVDGMIWKRQSN